MLLVVTRYAFCTHVLEDGNICGAVLHLPNVCTKCGAIDEGDGGDSDREENGKAPWWQFGCCRGK